MILDLDIKQYSGYTHLLLLETRALDMNNFVKYFVTLRGQTGFKTGMLTQWASNKQFGKLQLTVHQMGAANKLLLPHS